MSEQHIPRESERSLSRGFTLTELLIVVGVITLLMGLLLPGIGAVRKKAREASTLSLMGAVEQAAFMFRTDKNRMPGYFSPSQLASVSANTAHVTEGENMVLDLAGGVVADNAPGSAQDGIYVVPMGNTYHKVNVTSVGSPDGPGYLDLGRVHLSVDDDGEHEFSGSKVFRPMDDEDVYISNTGVDRPIPVVHDYFGKPLMVWTRNGSAGDNADFADITSDLVQDDNGRPRRAQYYWWQNAGLLASKSQFDASAIGADLANSSGIDGGIRKVMVPSMYAILGHPSFHTAPDEDGYVVPTVGLGEMVLQSAGSDRVFLADGAADSQILPGDDGTRKIRAFYSGHLAPPEPNERPMSAFDDLVHSGG